MASSSRFSSSRFQLASPQTDLDRSIPKEIARMQITTKPHYTTWPNSKSEKKPKRSVDLLVKFRRLFQRCSNFLREIPRILVEVSTGVFSFRVIHIPKIVESSRFQNLTRRNLNMFEHYVIGKVFASGLYLIYKVSRSKSDTDRMRMIYIV